MSCSIADPLCTCALQVNDTLAHLLSRMLDTDPATRATIAELAAHPWVTQGMPLSLESLNVRLAAAISSDMALQGFSGAAHDSHLLEAGGCGGGGGCGCAGCGGRLYPGVSHLRQLGGVRQSPAELMALVARAASS
jgi:hypothetical protein